ncbi:hypothetical protein ACNQ05_11475 [Enterobacter cloacae complex sp.6701062]|uniref:hypothetical protein n=1 Tax=unclassified Enterobacter cloacae complex TaxID=2757714 RepID=UPI003AAF60DE
MKLIDILLRHKDAIAERGEATNYFAMDPDGRVFGYQAMPEPDIMGWSVPGIKNSTDGFGCLVQINPIDVLEGWQEAIVTLKQYEAALAAIEQGWNGEGMPPIGSKVSFFYNERYDYHKEIIPEHGQELEVVAHKTTTDGHDVAVCYWDKSGGGMAVCLVPGSLLPIRSEADKKREEAETNLRTCLAGTGAGITPLAAKSIYDAIAAGKVPGIRIE